MPALIIDTAAKDGGLRKCLTDARVSAEVIAHITDTVGAEDLTDFVRACIHAAYETEVQTVFFDGVAQHKDNPIQLSRLSAAWLAAYKSQQRQQAMNPDATQNIEEPLGTTHKEEFATAWNVHYAKISFNEYLTGADGLTARQFREFRGKCHTVLSMSKVKALAWDRRPNETKRERVGEMVIEMNQPTQYTIRTVFEYYWALRIIAHTWAYCGNFEVESAVTPSKKVLYVSLGDALSYADECLRLTMEHGPIKGQLEWLRDRDEATRGKVVILARAGKPFGESLQEAMNALKVEWCLSQGRATQEQHRRSRTPRREHRSDPNTPRSTEKDSREKIGSTLPGGISICPDWATGGCTAKEKDCPRKRKHCCNRVLPSTGKPCGGIHRRADCNKA